MVAASEVRSREPCQETITAHVAVRIHATRVSSPRFGLTFSNSSKSSKDADVDSGRGSKARGALLTSSRTPSAAPQRLHSAAAAKFTSPQPAHFGLLAVVVTISVLPR